MHQLTHRKATLNDLRTIVSLLMEDKLGSTRETLSNELDQSYIDAFHKIDSDPNQYLMAIEIDVEIVGTCHLTIMPSLTFKGQTRMQIEAVRIAESCRGQHIGHQMMEYAIEYAKSKGATIIQLSTNKERLEAKKFYESIGFQATHEGMKLYLD
jgi:ribosomal protein S18 acetylase RimI-like enzyme